MSDYKATIGLEIHAELNTKSKMFCGCANDPHADTPNIHICPICLGHPGTLPVPNETAIESVLTVGTALGSQVATYSEFDRKNYFYPDIPKAYQISQYEFPFVVGGELAGVAITRVHLEEDTARSAHDGNGSIVDFNRAGVPLMELVTEPTIHSAEEAGRFARELQLLLRTLGVSDARMERGEMRIEANISVSTTNELGTKVEVKNLNSFKSVESAISHEIDRQIAEISSNRAIISETRGWDEEKLTTFSQRTKETADDYRYFPDPDIPSMSIAGVGFDISRITEKLPKLPKEIRDILISAGLTENQCDAVLLNQQVLELFLQVNDLVSTEDLQKVSINYITSDVTSLLDESDRAMHESAAPAFVSLMQLVVEGAINSRIAKDLLPEVVFDAIDPAQVANERNLMQVRDESALSAVVDEVIAEHESVVADVRDGKESAIQFLVGQGMKKTKGSADPKKLAEMLKKRIVG